MNTFDELKNTGLTERQAFAVVEANRQIARLETQIEDSGATITDRVERSIRIMNDGGSLNELGELQSRATEFDRLIAQRAQALDGMNNLLLSFEPDVASAVKKLLGR